MCLTKISVAESKHPFSLHILNQVKLSPLNIIFNDSKKKKQKKIFQKLKLIHSICSTLQLSILIFTKESHDTLKIEHKENIINTN